MKLLRPSVVMAAIGFSVVLATVTVTPPIASAAATQFDIHGPVGSAQFGSALTVLPNGNFVVVDSGWSSASAAAVGAVYLYNGRTNALISTLTGSTPNDRVGVGDVIVVGNSNFVVRSNQWNGSMGAATWVNGTTGLEGVVSAANSLVGQQPGDQVGSGQILALTNGNYVALSASWANGGAATAGAATFASGNVGITGFITSSNSLVGTHPTDRVGLSAAELSNGNYVVSSGRWNNGSIAGAGAVTWGNGTTGVVGNVTAANSLVGGTAADGVGLNAPTVAVTPLTNGNYVVTTGGWTNPATSTSSVGAATLADGTHGTAGLITSSNSLVGSRQGDLVGDYGAVALTNGNYVVKSPDWANTAAKPGAGAATWGNGTTGITGPATTTNSLVGTSSQDFVGDVRPLTNGNYVVLSPYWDDLFNGVIDAGAASWGNGNGGTFGGVNSSRALYGTTTGDLVGQSMIALTNGNYVVASFHWTNAAAGAAGAVTWRDGTGANAVAVGTGNSIVGSHSNDQVGDGSLTALSSGNYVISSPDWKNGALAGAGAVTWADGSKATATAVGIDNSLYGTSTNDHVGSWVIASPTGNFLVGSRGWNDDGALSGTGAFTWISGATHPAGPVTTANSIVGAHANDSLSGIAGVTLKGGEGFLAISPGYASGSHPRVGAVTFVAAGGPTSGEVTAANSVVGGLDNQGTNMTAATRLTSNGSVVVGRSAENIVTLLTPPQTARPDFVPLSPARLADTRPGQSTVDGFDAGAGALAAGATLQLPVSGRGGVAADAVGVALNVTAVDGAAAGFVTVFPCGSPQPTASNLNFTVGSTTPNAVFAKVGAGGKVCLFASQSTQLVVDVAGYFPATTSYVPHNPARVLETRPGLTTIDGVGQGAGPNAAGGTEVVQISGRAGVPAGATAVVLNVTVTAPAVAGFATVFPCGSPKPTASNVNFATGATVANLVVAKLGVGGQVCIFTSQSTQLVVDANGYFPALTGYLALNPARLLETRTGLSTIDGQFNGAGLQVGGSTVELQVTGRGGVPANAGTVVLNVTVTDPTAAGFVTVFPCGIPLPLASNLNDTAGATVANAVVVQVGTGGKVCIFTSTAANLIADVAGYYQN